ncbi:LOW QUALITY PROTEIN: uncharacterized protein LOC141577782 [Camelus bactrianus]|uniref:LOW QUALITY PROTEIN: uncharacterized protein LOC141577782 n=1 Tax=Camelus bactrianus TaxID=9837 RepID=A0AC58QF19_CAMBA
MAKNLEAYGDLRAMSGDPPQLGTALKHVGLAIAFGWIASGKSDPKGKVPSEPHALLTSQVGRSQNLLTSAITEAPPQSHWKSHQHVALGSFLGEIGEVRDHSGKDQQGLTPAGDSRLGLFTGSFLASHPPALALGPATRYRGLSFGVPSLTPEPPLRLLPGELELLAREVPARSPGAFDLSGVGGSLAEAVGSPPPAAASTPTLTPPTWKMPKSFLGPSTALVDLDSLVGRPGPTQPGAKASHSFLLTASPAAGHSITTHLQPAPPVMLTLNQLPYSPVPPVSAAPATCISRLGRGPGLPPMMPPEPPAPNTNPFLLQPREGRDFPHFCCLGDHICECM